MEIESDFTKLRYVLYARKSTDDPQHQIRSIKDQVAECKKYAIHNQLNIVKVLEEHQSAKKPHKRPVFSQMLSEIRQGKYDAILSWNPDRLARNMKEGGEIIDMIDEEVLKDIKFVTMYFTNDANGKMLLGMAFVLSKQYSDKLSQDVKRGNTRKFEEGKSHIPKHGYFLDELGLYHPDGDNFDLISRAWGMRSSGESLDKISNTINDLGYGRKVARSGNIIKLTKQILTNIFRDPFYYGLLVLRDGRSVDLKNAYNFESMISEDEFMSVQSLSRTRQNALNLNRRLTFYPLRGMVFCGVCSRQMVVGASTSSSKEHKKYLNFRCDNAKCTRKKRSIRAKIVFEYIYQLLDQLKFTEKEFTKYFKGLSRASDQRLERISKELISLRGQLKVINSELNWRSLKILEFSSNAVVVKENEARIAFLSEQKSRIEEEIQSRVITTSNPNQDKLTLKQFLNLSDKASELAKAGDAVTKHAICNLVFLNLTAGEDKMLSYQAKEPFAELFKTRYLITGGPIRT